MISNTDLMGAAVSAPNAAGAGDRPAAFEFDIAHHLPGRLRLRSAVLKGNARASEQAGHHLAQLRGVTAASANPITGSVLVEYNPDVLPAGKVIATLAAHGYVLRPNEPETEAGAKWADKIARAVTKWVIGALAERLAIAAIAALA